MKKLVLFFLAGFVGSSALMAQTDDKTLVKTLDPQGAGNIEFEFPIKDMDAKSWDSRTLRVELEIHANMTEEILQRLIKAGRYTMEGRLEGDKFIISAPNIEKRVTIGGVDLQEDLFVHAKTPEPMVVNKPKDGGSGRFSLEKDIDKMLSMSRTGRKKKDLKAEELALMVKINIPINVHVKLVNKSKTTSARKPKDRTPEELGMTPRGGQLVDKTAPATGAPTKDKKHGDILIDGVPIDYE